MVFQPEGWGSRSFEEVTNLVFLSRAALKLPLEMHEGEAPGISCEGLSQYYLNDLQTFFPDSFVAKVAAARCHHNECAAPPCPDQITETTLPSTCILYNSNKPKSERAERGAWSSGILEKCTSLEMVACCIFDNSTTASSALSLWMPCYMCVPDTALGDLSTFTSFDEWSASKGVCQHVGVTPWASYALVSQLVGNGSFPKEGPPPCLQSFPPQGPPAESLVPNTDEWTITLLLALSEEKSADVFMVLQPFA